MTHDLEDLPAAPEVSPAADARPGSATAAAVLAFIQAGITATTTLTMFDFNAEAWMSLLVRVAQLIGVGLLAYGGIQLMQGKSRTPLVAGAVLELVICLGYLVVFLLMPTLGLASVAGVRAVLVLIALLFAVLPTISLIQARRGTTTAWLGSCRAR
ncbi:hypothetical protein [Actinokineospora xionganensis]|uniref:Uncharacterized protein n=1 Tax=Actinokineospora xionganensis TaxID=2684470 RepID=A0ABR7L085_9PSEU|nr:hypothetical protein [Actinokineospora xionganensis]MBC6446049.1 hypothetical protein [Actinokineospora xionganensis]